MDTKKWINRFLPFFRIPVERFTVGGHGFPFSAPMFLAPQHHAPVPQSANSPMMAPPYHVRLAPPMGVPTYNFSQAEVDSLLYGYSKTRDDKCSGHALSCLRIGDLSHGQYANRNREGKGTTFKTKCYFKNIIGNIGNKYYESFYLKFALDNNFLFYLLRLKKLYPLLCCLV